VRGAIKLGALAVFTLCHSGLADQVAAPVDGATNPATPAGWVFDLELSDTGIRSQILSQGGKVVSDGPSGQVAVRFENPGHRERLLLTVPLDVASVRGAKLALTGQLQGKDVRALDPAVPLRSYEGLKFQIFVDSPSEGPRHFDTTNLHGTFSWREAGRIVSVPDDATQVKLTLGLEKALGAGVFASVRVRVVQPRVAHLKPSSPAPAATPRFRGVMSPQSFSEADFDEIARWNANLVRWQMWRAKDETRLFDQWLDAELDDISRALDVAQKRGIKVLIDLHSTPGGRLPDGTMRMFLERGLQEEFVRAWQKIATRFKDHPAVWGYDLINEPVQTLPSPEGVKNWLDLQVEAGKAVRKIDPKTPIIIETDEWDSPESFRWLTPVDLTNVIYQAHMYWPGKYTHQGVETDQGVAKDKLNADSLPYPGSYLGKPFDKEALRKYLAPVRDFQLAYGVPIYIGEFSAIRWAPGADRYLDDCISIFEEYGWDWTYHAFREWQGWSVEHADQPRDRNNHPQATVPTARKQVLRKWLDLNTPP